MDAFSMSSLSTTLPEDGLVVDSSGNSYHNLYQSNPYGVPAIRPDYLFLKYVLSDAGSHARTQPSVTSLAFDHDEELLWMGNEGGHVTSYYGLDMAKYTSFQVHQTNDIRSQLTGPYGLLSLTKNSLRLSIRRGLTVYDFTDDKMKDMYCMSRTENPHSILMAGQQDELLDFNLHLMKVVRVTNLTDSHSASGDSSSPTSSSPGNNPGCMIIRSHSKFVCCGDAEGKITLRDKNSLKVVNVFQSHSGQLSDFDVLGNHLVTCGASSRNGIFTIDRFLMVYDLRMLKAIAPIGMNFAPFFLRFVPIYSSKFCVVSQTGQFQLLDTVGPSTPPPFLHAIDLPPGASVSAFDVSNSSQAVSFGDNAGYIYLFGASTEIAFNVNSQATEFADELDRLPPIIPYDDTSTPLSTVPPYVVPPTSLLEEGHEQSEDRLSEWMASLFSTWPSSATQKVYRQSRSIDPEILSGMKMTGSVGYAPNPGPGRYQDIYLSVEESIRPDGTIVTGEEAEEKDLLVLDVEDEVPVQEPQVIPTDQDLITNDNGDHDNHQESATQD